MRYAWAAGFQLVPKVPLRCRRSRCPPLPRSRPQPRRPSTVPSGCARRARAGERFAASPLPSTEEEVWKYSRIKELDLDRYSLSSEVPPGQGVPPALGPVVAAIGAHAAVVVTVNGHIVHTTVDDALVSKGLRVGAADDAALVGDIDIDLFVTMNAAFGGDAARDRRPRRPGRRAADRGAPLARPRWRAASRERSSRRRAEPGPRWWSTRRRRSRRAVRSRHRAVRGPSGQPALCRRAEPRPPRMAARLRAQQRRARRVPRVGGVSPSVATTPGCAPTRVLVGQGATSNLHAVYFGDRHADARLPHPSGPRRRRARPATCCSRARSAASRIRVYTGLIRVRPGAARHQRVPDEPQPGAQRGRARRVGAQPRDRGERRQLQPRIGDRADRPRPALLPRVPRRAAPASPTG